MKSTLKFYDANSHLLSNCNDHFSVELSSEGLNWNGILLEKGTSTHFNPRNVYTEDFLFSMELSHEFTWNVHSKQEEVSVTTSIGSIWLNAPSFKIDHTNNNPAEYLALSISKDTLLKNIDATIDRDQLAFLTNYSIEDDMLVNMMKLFYLELETSNENGIQFIENLLRLFSHYFLNNYTNLNALISSGSLNATITKSSLSTIDQYIYEHISENISIEQLARTLNMNKFHFLNEFKKSIGITPYQYILKTRIDEAKYLLKNTDNTIVNIALDLGFNDSSHFSRTFSRYTNVTPRKFRLSPLVD